MKTAVIIGTRGLEAFDPGLFEEPGSVRLVLVSTERDAAEHLTAEQRGWFDAIRLVPGSAPDPEPLLVPQVDADAAADVVAGVSAEAGHGPAPTVHCYAEQNLLAAARIRERLDLDGPRPADIVPFLDKLEMKRRVAAAGVRVPAFGRWEPARYAAGARAYFDRLVGEVGLPFVLKPTDAAGSLGVVFVESWADFAALPAGGELGRAYEYEEFVDGTLYSVNIVSAGGRTVFGGVTEYLVNSSEVAEGRVNADINLLDDDPRVGRMVAFAGRALDALGRPDGASHLELFRTASDELVFLEVGARFKGMSGLAAMQRHYGLALVNLAFGIESGVRSRPWEGEQVYCFDACLPLREGVIRELVEPELESAYEMRWTVRPGDRVARTSDLVTVGGTFLVWNADFAALSRDFRALAGYQPFTYEPAALRVPEGSAA
ncbi:acetyl-CoA carboxylase biotin carboxylase subunit family protein [Streptomyces sp. JJ36]|uniref:ATP-grasp domain-containing protein n=1 Tax=Streptomyces sp. JJ36 TaxID=2736645 RepID=UPI001F032378|nr:ATP-grasp domain-containing protein [Streptomyces sp. JJ36]MCF6524109.1 ATP-grasp domain-containing protein [Streptomyces sp. JJ36]